MIQVVVEKNTLQNPDEWLLFLQPNTFRFHKVAYQHTSQPHINRVAPPLPPRNQFMRQSTIIFQFIS